jgi:hypothetical protein
MGRRIPRPGLNCHSPGTRGTRSSVAEWFKGEIGMIQGARALIAGLF